jgi:RimJ/RimL family protein N-acetyltransferase
MSARDVVPNLVPTIIDDKNVDLLRYRFRDWLPDIPYRQPFMALIEGGHAVSICASVRISEAVHCAGVETHPDYRQRGYALDVVAGWAHAVRSRGATPFYSTSWDNVASRRVASRLGFLLVGVDFHIT